MTREKPKEQPPLSNVVSEETGQFDARFVLWRKFCAENGVPVETLPSQLSGENKEKWERLKENSLKKSKE